MTTREMRPWTWTPPPFMNHIMTLVLQTPLLHCVISHNILLLTYTGRKSGQHYTLPVGYWRQGYMVMLLTKHFRTWWRNFEQPALVQLHIGRKYYTGLARAITEETTIISVLTELMVRHPQYHPHHHDCRRSFLIPFKEAAVAKNF